MTALIREVVDVVGPAFHSAGYAIVAAAVLAERSILVGLLVPGDIVVALGGVYAARGVLELTVVMSIGALCGVAGESAGYWLGRRYGRGLLERLPLARRLARHIPSLERHFDRHGGTTVAIGRYASEAGALVPFAAGVSKMPYPRFLLFDVPAVSVWAVGTSLVGYAFGRNLDLVESILSRFGWAILGAVVLFVVGRVAWKRLHQRP